MRIPKILSNNKKSEYVGESNNIEISKLLVSNVTDFKYAFLDFEDQKNYKKYISLCERLIRNSLEYRGYIGYLKENVGLTSCKFLTNIDLKNTSKVSIEFHHYPFNLFELVDIIIREHSNFYSQSVSTFAICNDVLRLHYENLVGLVPLAKTIHELAHSGEVFINLNLVHGNVEEFVYKYKDFIPDELLASLDTLKTLSSNEKLQTNNYILKKRFQEIVTSEKRNLHPIISANDECKLA